MSQIYIKVGMQKRNYAHQQYFKPRTNTYLIERASYKQLTSLAFRNMLMGTSSHAVNGTMDVGAQRTNSMLPTASEIQHHYHLQPSSVMDRRRRVSQAL